MRKLLIVILLFYFSALILIYSTLLSELSENFCKLFSKKLVTFESENFCKLFGKKESIQFRKSMKTFSKKIKNFSKNNSKKISHEFNGVYKLENILTKSECDWIIYESELYAQDNGWSLNRHDNYPTIDNEITNEMNINYFLQNIIYTKIIPEFSRFNINTKYLGLDELFIVKYKYPKYPNNNNKKTQVSLQQHTDDDDFSFVITLNDSFTGGGTKFKGMPTIQTNVGDVLIFCGKHKHQGVPITSGTRYIIAGFTSNFNKNLLQKK